VWWCAHSQSAALWMICGYQGGGAHSWAALNAIDSCCMRGRWCKNRHCKSEYRLE
jgi:hypothetical protein